MLSRDSEDQFDRVLCLKLNMTSKSYFDKMNSTLGSVVPLVMFCHDLVSNILYFLVTGNPLTA